jgi:transmembrane 9 superfamily protein 2/4
MIVLFLTGMVATIMCRTLRKDIARYNEDSDEMDETGWKLVYGDVFRPPTGCLGPMMLSVSIGTGAQLMLMSLATLFFALLGFLSPANRGMLLTAMLLLYVFMGSGAGYWSSRMYKMMRGKNWKSNTLFTALVFPGLAFIVVFLLNLVVWYEGSSSAIPFVTMLSLLLMWFGISVPLAFAGSYFGFRQEMIPPPVKPTEIPRQIPDQSLFMHPVLIMLCGGILPFGAVFMEVFFIMKSLWLHQVYYVFGFLTVIWFIMVIVCAEISIVMCYFQLCSEDYKWWWRSFLTSGASALYLFLYAIVYYSTKLDITALSSTVLYFGYMGLISVALFFIAGTIGFLSTLVFVRKIYAAIKVE